MPQRRPPRFPVPYGVIWHHFHAGMPTGKPLAEWAYTTPLHPQGLLTSDLPHKTRGEQDATATHWFLVNFQPLGGGWAAYNTPEAGGYGVGGGYAPLSWPASELMQEEFEGLLPPDLIDEVAARFAAQSNLWRVIPGLIHTPTVNIAIADLPETMGEVKLRLNRVEMLSAADEQARQGAGANELTSVITHRIKIEVAVSITDTRTGLASPQPAQAAAAAQAESAFRPIAAELGKSIARQAGKMGTEWLANNGLWLWQEIEHLLPALRHWWDLLR